MNKIFGVKMCWLACAAWMALFVGGSALGNGWGGGYSKGSVSGPLNFMTDANSDEESSDDSDEEISVQSGVAADSINERGASIQGSGGIQVSVEESILPITARVKMLAEQCVSGQNRGFYTADDFCDMIPKILGLDSSEVLEISSRPNGSLHLQVTSAGQETLNIILP
jgi:hypothetical protein